MATNDDDRPYGPVAPSPVERDVSPVSSGRSGLTTNQKIGAVLAVGAVAVGVIVLTHDPFAHHKRAAKTRPANTANGLAFHSTVGTATKPAATTKPVSLPLPARSSPFSSPFMQNQETPAMKAINAPIFAYTGTPTATASATSGASVTPASAVGQARPPMPLSNALRSSHFDHVDARLIAHPNFTIAAGTLISCTLQTAIDSGLPGFVKCVLPNSVRSMTGTVTLLDRGTQVIGQIQQGLVQGQDRLFILWTRAITPQNVVVNLGSPGAGPLGRAGVSGAVDNHFFERFGSAIMLSIIGGSLEAGANAAQSGSGNTYFQSLNTNTNQIANTALQSTIDIPPTLKKNQGDNVSIFVARDLNFSHVYKLSLVNP